MATLAYETASARRGVTVEDDGQRATITIAQRAVFDVSKFLGMGSFYLLVYLRARFKRVRPPRAEFEVTARSVIITMHEPEDDTVSKITLRRTPDLELRPNRYESGLYIEAPGQSRTTILADLSEPLICWLAAELAAAFERHPAADSLSG